MMAIRSSIAGSMLMGFFIAWGPDAARAHEAYTGLHGKDGQLCCGADDCARTSYRLHGAHFELLTREERWVAIPADRITFVSLPGDEAADEHTGHLCYRIANDGDRVGDPENVFDYIYFYCAFISPGGV
jgi:hypothetical protein